MVTSVAQGPSFRILDLTADEIFTARRNAKEEQKEALEQSVEEAEIIGDKHSKVYYPADCELAKEVSEANRTAFKTALEAEKAGYKAATGCK